jgi:hypothetical protein
MSPTTSRALWPLYGLLASGALYADAATSEGSTDEPL